MIAIYINFYLLLTLNYMLDFLRLAGTQVCPRVCGYPQIVGTSIVLYLWWVVGVGAGTGLGLGLQVQVCGSVPAWVLPIAIIVDSSSCNHGVTTHVLKSC